MKTDSTCNMLPFCTRIRLRMTHISLNLMESFDGVFRTTCFPSDFIRNVMGFTIVPRAKCMIRLFLSSYCTGCRFCSLPWFVWLVCQSVSRQVCGNSYSVLLKYRMGTHLSIFCFADMQFSFVLFCGYAGVNLLSPIMHNLWIWRVC